MIFYKVRDGGGVRVGHILKIFNLPLTIPEIIAQANVTYFFTRMKTSQERFD